MRGKKVIVEPRIGKPLPRIVQPMDRPVTPRIDARVTTARQSSRLNMSSMSTLPDLPDLSDESPSRFDQVAAEFSNAKNPDMVLNALHSFQVAAAAIANDGEFRSNDMISYKKIHNTLTKLLENPQAPFLVPLASGLRSIIAASTSNNEPFYHFLSKVLFKLSADKNNDSFFEDNSLCNFIIGSTNSKHKVETRVYSVVTLKNASHSANFRKMLQSSINFRMLFDLFEDNSPKAVQLLTQLTQLFRSIIQDPSGVTLLVSNDIQLRLFETAKVYTKEADLVFNVFRIMTHLSSMTHVQASILQSFEPMGTAEIMLNVIKLHQTNSNIIARVGYVFSDFTSNESFLDTAHETDLLILSETLPVCGSTEATAMLLQVIANLSVKQQNASVFELSEELPQMFGVCTYGEDDHVGQNLLCAASNICFHDNHWSPNELLSAIPTAIISKCITSIVESLRILCNLALCPNTALIESQIPELLCVLMRHLNGDVVLFSLQALTNLINHAGIRRRFRESGGIDAIIEILEGDQIDSEILEAVAKLTMNFDAISNEEASTLLTLVEGFEIDPSIEIFTTWKTFLKERER